MPYDLSKLLVVAISSSALFDSRAEHRIFLKRGVEDYVDYQVAHEGEPLAAGTALPLIRALLRLNDLPGPKRKGADDRLVEVVIISQNQPAAGLRIMNSVEHHKLDITRAAFTGGEPVAPYLKSYNVTLFLSRNEQDVREALEQGIAAGLLYDPPKDPTVELEQLRIALDGDAVIFSDESERIYQTKGLEEFARHERVNAKRPLAEGPFASFLRAIAKIQNHYREAAIAGIPPIKTALVTARSSPAHARVIRTLREWGVKIDEMFFLGGVSKDKVLHQFRPHIFFDDQDVHAQPASRLVPSARVPPRPDPAPLDPDQRKLPFAGVLKPTPKEDAEARRKGKLAQAKPKGADTQQTLPDVPAEALPKASPKQAPAGAKAAAAKHPAPKPAAPKPAAPKPAAPKPAVAKPSSKPGVKKKAAKAPKPAKAPGKKKPRPAKR